ncbi:MAG: DNA-3-methyladenine glycosylase 2 family protein [Woeseia sp.]|nr:DNA-3-methyladenine glycosylase 2 family protein [Woeseia sp.]NNL53959.1 DNA-3-methyladenine glycosylase 2 family protein [Woeseia sp.]
MYNEVFERARKARDPRFDGRFFIGVRTTGIYCRPICPATTPKRENIDFFLSAAAASEAGLRPCLRCRPECAPGTPAWAGTSTTVRRGLRLIDGGALDHGDVEALAERLGITSRHLRRLFTMHLGASPLAIAHTRRLHFAKRLIDDTALPMNHIAIAAGYGSVRRFNDAFRKTYNRAPRDLRRMKLEPTVASASLTVRLQYREPYRWNDVLGFYGLRATPGVESIESGCYRRTLMISGKPALIEVRADEKPGALLLTLTDVAAEHLFKIVQKTREVFDLDAPTHDIAEALGKDQRLRGLLKHQPGVRVPGAWNGFELAVRAVLGQQISVRAATTLAGRIAERYGTPLKKPLHGLTHLFPTPAQLRRVRFNNIGLVKSRAQTLRDLAAAVDDGDITFDPLQDEQSFCERFCEIRGIGDWTAQYVLMRALKNPDALPTGDLGLIKALYPDRRATPAELQSHSEDWRPWRAYAAMLLWGAAPGG